MKSMLKSWKVWYNEADMPMQDKDGDWYDAETGHYWKDSAIREETLQKDPLFKQTHAQLSSSVEKLMRSLEYGINKHKDILEYSEAVKASVSLLNYYNASKEFKKLTKQDLVNIINKNSDISRMFNAVKVSLAGTHN